MKELKNLARQIPADCNDVSTLVEDARAFMTGEKIAGARNRLAAARQRVFLPGRTCLDQRMPSYLTPGCYENVRERLTGPHIL